MKCHRTGAKPAAVLLCVIMLGAAALAQFTPGKPSYPALSSFSPTQGVQGSTVTITFTGSNFVARALSLQFSPNQGLTITSLQVISPTQITAQVRIDASAALGARGVFLIDADRGLPSRLGFTILPAQTCGVPGTPACPPLPPAPPVLRGFSPIQGTQGTTVMLLLSGANFVSPASVQFIPAAGLTVLSTTVLNATQVRAQVQIAPTAPLGPRQVGLLLSNTRLLARSNTFTVVAAAPIPRPVVLPQILRVIPNQIPAGSQGVDLSIQGINFVPGMQVNFTVGAGVPSAIYVAGASRYLNSTEIHVTVNVLPTALPGGRDINLQAPGQQNILGKGMLNVLAAPANKKPGLLPALKITPIALQTFAKGVIQLDTPLWGDHWEGEIETQYGIPLIDDDMVFRWHEQNPGLADYYELRIYSRDGKTLLATKKINGGSVTLFGHQMTLVPTYYRPDAAFLAGLLSQMPKLVPLGFVYPSKPYKKPVALHGILLKGSAPSGPQLSNGDMQWEVAGFRTYNKNGVAKQQGPANLQVAFKPGAPNSPQPNPSAQPQSGPSGQTDIEVEVSDRWPLGRPAAPSGLSCPGGGMGNGLQVTNVADKTVYDDKGNPTGGIDPNNYVGDNWVLSGNFDLSRSPYATHPNLHQLPGSQCSNCLFGQVDQVQFDNLFVDWGDGTVARLNAPPSNSGVTNWSRGVQLSLPPDAKSQYSIQHAYQYPGSYVVRVFQLSEADAQNVNASLVAASVDGPGIHPFLQTVALSGLTKQGGGSFHGNVRGAFQSAISHSISGTQGPNPSDVASRAYMIYCNTIAITVPEDLDADGPLHLKSIDDPHFPGHDPVRGIGPSKGIRMNPAGAANHESMPHLLRVSAAQRKPAIQPRLPLGTSSSGPVAMCSTCDDGMMAVSALHFYGRGQVSVTWHMDGSTAQQTFALGPSDPRKNLTRGGKGIKQPDIIISTSPPVNSPALQLQPLGMHAVTVEADVLPEPSLPNLSIAVQKTLGSLLRPPPAGPKSPALNPQGVAQAQSLLNTLAPPPGSNLPPLKIGILSPTVQNSGGLGAVQYVNGPLREAVSKLTAPLPDQHVASNTSNYQVVAADPNKPCKFLFPVKSGGAFEISGLQGHVTSQGTKYNGTGTLIIHLANSSSDGYDLYPPIPVKIQNWDVPDGQHVSSGVIDVAPQLQLAAGVPGLKGTVDRLQGKAGGELDATLSVTLSDDTLRLPGVEKPQSWNAVTAELHANGDWIKDGLNLPSTLIGWSAFRMQSTNVRLDLSHHDGDAAGSLCGGLSGGDWVGVRFPSLTLTPYTMDLVSSSALQPIVHDWAVVGSGLCGSLSTGAFSAKLGNGSISFTSINATAANGSFDAQYKGMDIYVPWLDTHLKGDAYLQSGGGKQAAIHFPFSGTATAKTYGNIRLNATNLEFTKEQNIGWVVKSDTHFDFVAENKPFASFDTKVFYGMDGRGYFSQGSKAEDIPLGGSSHLGETPIDLVSAHLTAPASGATIFGVQFNTNVHISEVMAATPAQVNYEIDATNNKYSATGPVNSPFTVDVPYPAGQPSSEAKVHPVYNGEHDTEYTGTVDLSEFGGPPVTGEFRLGYQNGHDYWLTRVSFDLGSEGVVLIPAPPIMNLYKIRGGIGHNFPITAFKDAGSINSVSPVFDNSFLFMAGMRVGMPDQFTYTVDGDLVIKATGQDAGARMDFHAWLLKSQHDGNGDFQGYFQYAGGAFDGRLWGHLDFMSGAVSLDMGNSENNAAIDMHFGNNGPWHIDAGKKEGPRIRGHFLIADADSYFMLSDQGLALGGGTSIDLEVGDDSVASAFVRGSVDMGLAITPQPHISGDFAASVSAGICVDNVCVSDGVTAQVHAECAPLDIRAQATLGLPWPLSDVTFSVHL